MSLNIRCNSWLSSAANLSWVYVMERLLNAWENMGHKTHIVSTNGLGDGSVFSLDKMSKSLIELEKFGLGKRAIDLDITYTVPQNFPQRFLANSKHKAAIYNYETTIWPVSNWKQYYGIVDYYFPSSNFSAEIFVRNGIPQEKTFVIPHGVDTAMFNPDIPKINLKTKKTFKFCCVAAPHARKNLPTLLHAYCQAFNKQDDVCLVLKTKVFKHSDGMFDANTNPNGRKPFEIVLGDVFKELFKKFGNNMPEIEIISNRIDNVASIYNSCQVHVTATGAEGFGMPLAEVLNCNMINIAPNYSGHLDFLNEQNSLLVDTDLRYAKREEQYWNYDPKSKIGQPRLNHLSELMIKSYKEYFVLSPKNRS